MLLLLCLTLILISENVIQAKELNTKDLAEKFASLELELKEMKSAQLGIAVNTELKSTKTENLIEAKELNTKDLTNRVADLELEQSKNKQLRENMIDMQNELDELKKEFVQHLNDSSANEAELVQYLEEVKVNQAGFLVLNEIVAELVEQVKNLQLQLPTYRRFTFTRTVNKVPIPPATKRFTLPPDVSQLVGSRVPAGGSFGPISSASVNGSWTFKTCEWWSQNKTDTAWWWIMGGTSLIDSAPMILPMAPHIVVMFQLVGHTRNAMQIQLYSYPILFPRISFKFDVIIRIQDNGFTEIQKCSFRVHGIGYWIMSSNSIQINKNWTRSKFPKDIEFLFL